MADIYEQLRIRLDEMATGYPATEGGVEIRILKQLFSEVDATLFLAMALRPETAAEMASRVQSDPDDLTVRLEDMAHRGLIFRLKEEEPRYFPIPFIVGIYEFQLNNLNPELLRDISEYYLTGLGATFHGSRTPHLRSIPISTRIVPDGPIAAYDDAEAIIRGKTRIAVAECFCRKAVRMYGKVCPHPLETCIQFDSFADYYVENGLARYISMEEALAILRRNEEEGLVIHILNSRKVEAMCACCSCCCGMLISLKLFPAPAREVKSNYVCRFDESLCTDCGVCAGRCPVGALRRKDDRIQFRVERCIGCGLCVTNCSSGALTLLKKSEDKLYTPPETVFETFNLMCTEKRGT
ncbi:MAG TPA: 4Fe-4S binding protein [Deltaproteobacteria bacterium]|nr:4Fe-4S binding protein [Deltaproteobacteria bacterium]